MSVFVCIVDGVVLDGHKTMDECMAHAEIVKTKIATANLLRVAGCPEALCVSNLQIPIASELGITRSDIDAEVAVITNFMARELPL